MGWFDKKPPPPPISATDAARMTPRKILAEIKKGRTVTGFNQELAEHFASGDLKDKSIKDLDKSFAKKGSFDTVGVIKRHGDIGGLLAGVKGHPARLVSKPPAQRKGQGMGAKGWNPAARGARPPEGSTRSGRVVARPLSETMHPAAYRALLEKEAKRQKLI